MANKPTKKSDPTNRILIQKIPEPYRVRVIDQDGNILAEKFLRNHFAADNAARILKAEFNTTDPVTVGWDYAEIKKED